MLSHSGNLDRAFNLARRARELNPNDPNVIDTIGWIQLKRNLAGNAIVAFDQAIEGEPSNPSFHYHLGMAWAAYGDPDRAAKALKTALTLNPSPTDRESIRQLLDRLQR